MSRIQEIRRSRVAAILVAGGLTLTALASPAAAAEAGAGGSALRAAAYPCGFSESGGSAWWRHCGTGSGYGSWIHVSRVGLDYETCVAVGTTRHLGASWVVYDAWSEGQCSL